MPSLLRFDSITSNNLGARNFKLFPFGGRNWSVFRNGIVLLFSRKKAHTTFAGNFPRMILEEDGEIGESQTTYRLSVLEKYIDDAMTLVTPMMAIRYVNHVTKHYPACIDLKDLEVGKKLKERWPKLLLLTRIIFFPIEFSVFLN